MFFFIMGTNLLKCWLHILLKKLKKIYTVLEKKKLNTMVISGMCTVIHSMGQQGGHTKFPCVLCE